GPSISEQPQRGVDSDWAESHRAHSNLGPLGLAARSRRIPRATPAQPWAIESRPIRGCPSGVETKARCVAPGRKRQKEKGTEERFPFRPFCLFDRSDFCYQNPPP